MLSYSPQSSFTAALHVQMSISLPRSSASKLATPGDRNTPLYPQRCLSEFPVGPTERGRWENFHPPPETGVRPPARGPRGNASPGGLAKGPQYTRTQLLPAPSITAPRASGQQCAGSRPGQRGPAISTSRSSTVRLLPRFKALGTEAQGTRSSSRKHRLEPLRRRPHSRVPC